MPSLLLIITIGPLDNKSNSYKLRIIDVIKVYLYHYVNTQMNYIYLNMVISDIVVETSGSFMKFMIFMIT